MQATETTDLTTTSHPQNVWERHVDDSFLLYGNPTYMTSFNLSTVFTPRQILQWKLNRIPNSHSWTHSSRRIVTTPSPSTGNLHTQTNTLNFTSDIMTIPKIRNKQHQKEINLPYEKSTSEQLKRILNDHNINCTFYTTATLRTLLSHAKDPVPSEQRNNIVNQYDFNDCEAVCFGESKRTLAERTKAHTRAVRAADTRRYETADHSWKYNHDFD